MFDTFVVEPIFNLLVVIYAILPGHNFGLALIIFTVLARLLMWPLVKKQLHHTKAMRKMQPELKRIKKASKGDKRKEQTMVMELYKERGLSPFGSIGTIAIQFIVLIGLYSGLRRVANDPSALVNFAYGTIQELPKIKELAANINMFDGTLLGWVDLQKAAYSGGVLYAPALVFVVGSSVAQFYQSKQLLPTDKDQRGLRQILRDANQGKQSDQQEVSMAVAQSTRYFLPVMIGFITLGLPSALGLYWLVSGAVAYWQQKKVLDQDEDELEALAAGSAEVIEGEVVEKEDTPASHLNPNRRRKGSKVPGARSSEPKPKQAKKAKKRKGKKK